MTFKEFHYLIGKPKGAIMYFGIGYTLIILGYWWFA